MRYPVSKPRIGIHQGFTKADGKELDNDKVMLVAWVRGGVSSIVSADILHVYCLRILPI